MLRYITMKMHKHECGWLTWLLIAMSLILARPLRVAAAADAPHEQALTLNAGETHIIDNISPDSKPAIRVIDNPHALVVHSEDPSKLVLLGAEEGQWAITIKLNDGEDVIYNVTVHAIRDAAHPLKPADTAANAASAASVEPPSSPLDAGTGPVTGIKSASAPAGAKDVSSRKAPETVAASESASAGAAPAALQSSAVVPSQIASSAAQEKPTTFRTDPGLIKSGGVYSTEGVASSGGTHYLPADGMNLMIGTSQVIDFPQRMRRVSIADTTVADVQVVNPFQLNLIAHKPGFTTLTVWTEHGHYEERQVRVDPSGKQQVMLNCIVAELDRGKVESQGTNLTSAFPALGLSMVGLPGAVATPYNPQTSLGGNAILPNGTTVPLGGANLPPGGALAPLVFSQNMTYGIAAQNSQMQWQGFFQYLENHSLGKVLAQPHLLANSGEKAKFLSGGEIPIVIAQALNTSIVFKEFGTRVTFVPTVVGVNDIELLVEPEVSQPDYAHGVQMFGFQVPAFVTRRAETLVRLRDNQTLIIAGLILHQKNAVVQKVPYLGDLPFAGGLFRNTNWQDTETDLVMSVTPEIVRPLPTGAGVFMPSERGPLTAEEIRTSHLDTPDAARPRF